MYDLKLKIWLVKDGRFLISDGRATLLRKIRDLGSMSKAAKDMGMSYRHAWDVLQRISDNAGGDVVRSSRGGREGGVSELTELGEKILAEYDGKAGSLESQIANEWRKPSLTADAVVVEGDRILLIRRGRDPFKDSYALPGGFVEYGERLEECVARETKEETGLECEVVRLLGVRSDPDRDPRGHFVTAVYLMRPKGGRLKAGDDAKEVKWFSVDEVPPMAFDHGDIVSEFVSRAKDEEDG
jgi:8-oxo-dGTP diphosphatase